MASTVAVRAKCVQDFKSLIRTSWMRREMITWDHRFEARNINICSSQHTQFLYCCLHVLPWYLHLLNLKMKLLPKMYRCITMLLCLDKNNPKWIQVAQSVSRSTQTSGAQLKPSKDSASCEPFSSWCKGSSKDVLPTPFEKAAALAALCCAASPSAASAHCKYLFFFGEKTVAWWWEDIKRGF